ncbi:flagellar hook-basal body complex protein [Clostridium senegalense]|uniref:flagellar hook-basal body complex protein n=1 Tax=Clostridium senegalense TaxID=1465809 RepID=UPI001C1219DB|nr:flagellar hook-basal body complex protein [Clostridium senegalense]MBU5225378.1 flagellar hook-basal body complex protein [Clostridium senegalense]
MIKSMYSGISGMNAQQKKLDVIGNNIANSGTTSFKSSRVTFQDTMRETIGKGSGPVLALGGSNPKQIGMGVNLQSIEVNTGQGSLNPTGRPLDNAIDGSGYFIVGKGPVNGSVNITGTGDAEGTIEPFYTRDGEFKRDSLGNLVTPNGYRVMGYYPDKSAATVAYDDTSKKIEVEVSELADGEVERAEGKFEGDLKPLVIPETVKCGDKDIKVTGFTIEKDGILKVSLEDGTSAVIGQVAMASFVNDGGLEGVGQNMYVPGANSGKPAYRPGKGSDNEKAAAAYGSIINGMLEMSNVDLAVEFTEMIVASRSFQACSKVITTGDEILQELVNLKR